MAKRRILGNRDGRLPQVVFEGHCGDTQVLRAAAGYFHAGGLGLVKDYLMSTPKILLVMGAESDAPAEKEINLGHMEKEIQDGARAITYPKKVAAPVDSLFYRRYIGASDRCHLVLSDTRSFSFNIGDLPRTAVAKFKGVSKNLVDNHQKNSRIRNAYAEHGNRACREFEPHLCKHVIDKTGKVLTSHRGLASHELKCIQELDPCHRTGGRP